MSHKTSFIMVALLLLAQTLSGCSSNTAKSSTKIPSDSSRALQTAQVMVEQGDYKGAEKLIKQINPKNLAVRDRYLHEQLLAQLGQPLKIKKAVPHPKMSVFFEPSDCTDMPLVDIILRVSANSANRPTAVGSLNAIITPVIKENIRYHLFF